MLALDLLNAALAVLFNLHGSQPFLLVHNLILHAILLFDPEVLELLFLLVLLLDNLGLLGLFTLGLEYGFLHLPLLILSLLVHRVVVLGHHALVLVLNLIVVKFLSSGEC